MEPEDGASRQKRHYEYFGQLQTMLSSLPTLIQQRIPLELLSNLASALLDNTVFEIVIGLQEIQQITEKSLSESRNKLVLQQRNERIEKQRKHRDLLQTNQAAPHRLSLIQQENERQLREHDDAAALALENADKRIIAEIDQLVAQQQSTLEKAGVPGFYITTNAIEIEVQMHLLDFVTRLCSTRIM